MPVRQSPAKLFSVGQHVWVYSAPSPPSRAIVTEITYTSAIKVRPNGDVIPRLTWLPKQVFATREALLAKMRSDAAEILDYAEKLEQVKVNGIPADA